MFIAYSADATQVTEAQYFEYIGDKNDWNRVVSSEDNNVHFLAAYADGWTDLDFQFFNVD